MGVEIIGHRGAMDYKRQNTLSSFREAFLRGADAIEFDVQMSKHGILVVYHDDTLETLTDGNGPVSDYTVSELKELQVRTSTQKVQQKLHLPHRDITIPTLEEVLNLVNSYRKRQPWVNVELKIKGIEEEANDFLESYSKKNRWTRDRILVSSFYHNQLLNLRRLNSNIRIGALFDAEPVDYNEFIMKLRPYSSHPNIDSVTEQLVEDAHRRKLKVYVGTVVNEQQARKVIATGADGFFANAPDVARQWAMKYKS